MRVKIAITLKRSATAPDSNKEAKEHIRFPGPGTYNLGPGSWDLGPGSWVLGPMKQGT